ncbi:hypothetical protein W02_08720 [Nitrospira sp. KM1]|uniref:hypothetical protein n=1 Tax=Nitrospira sp. KM1 TaxID=1936990 RepID=UPI0013A7255D|nr:hypothetical protein [Nitrospira sp. KM1]BCA53732.1 hypothetical protein W02_08720 [Nitrospira sp. KM1]
MPHANKTNTSAKMFVAVVGGFIITLQVMNAWGEKPKSIDVVDKTGVDVLCKGKGAYTGPTTLSNFSSCMYNDGSSVTCENKRDGKCTSTSPKAQAQNPTKTVPQGQLMPAQRK